MTTLVTMWILLGVATLALALYRKFISMREDNYVHVSEGEQRYIPKQVAIFHRLGVIDRWGVSLTIVETVFGLALALAYVLQFVTQHP